MTEFKNKQTSEQPWFSSSGAGLGFSSSSHVWAATAEIDTLVLLL